MAPMVALLGEPLPIGMDMSNGLGLELSPTPPGAKQQAAAANGAAPRRGLTFDEPGGMRGDKEAGCSAEAGPSQPGGPSSTARASSSQQPRPEAEGNLLGDVCDRLAGLTKLSLGERWGR